MSGATAAAAAYGRLRVEAHNHAKEARRLGCEAREAPRPTAYKPTSARDRILIVLPRHGTRLLQSLRAHDRTGQGVNCRQFVDAVVSLGMLRGLEAVQSIQKMGALAPAGVCLSRSCARAALELR